MMSVLSSPHVRMSDLDRDRVGPGGFHRRWSAGYAAHHHSERLSASQAGEKKEPPLRPVPVAVTGRHTTWTVEHSNRSSRATDTNHRNLDRIPLQDPHGHSGRPRNTAQITSSARHVHHVARMLLHGPVITALRVGNDIN